MHRLAEATADYVGMRGGIARSAVVANCDYVGPGYGQPTPGMTEAVLMLARLEGVLLDPVYSGKAMAGLIDLIRKGEIGKGETVVFLHTGGAVGLFGYTGVFEQAMGRLENAAADAVLQRQGVEIEQQPDAASTEAQIGEELRLVQGQDVLDRFQFQDHVVIDDDVGPVSTVEKGPAHSSTAARPAARRRAHSDRIRGTGSVRRRFRASRGQGVYALAWRGR